MRVPASDHRPVARDEQRHRAVGQPARHQVPRLVDGGAERRRSKRERKSRNPSTDADADAACSRRFRLLGGWVESAQRAVECGRPHCARFGQHQRGDYPAARQRCHFAQLEPRAAPDPSARRRRWIRFKAPHTRVAVAPARDDRSSPHVNGRDPATVVLGEDRHGGARRVEVVRVHKRRHRKRRTRVQVAHYNVARGCPHGGERPVAHRQAAHPVVTNEADSRSAVPLTPAQRACAPLVGELRSALAQRRKELRVAHR
mmetsp:Transcript_13103/g.30778  ORF Transcript_13103/g.30778 Transcript_13103/m.30778 type:complete len:258 (+) Transcript_13103:727-1500(+)